MKIDSRLHAEEVMRSIQEEQALDKQIDKLFAVLVSGKATAQDRSDLHRATAARTRTLNFGE